MVGTKSTPVPINVVGSSTFGRYPKISAERTLNMFISDDWLVNYAGFQARICFPGGNEGRGLFHSTKGNFLIVVVESAVYKVDPSLAFQLVGEIETGSCEVSMDENLNFQIAIVDGQNMYIFNYDENSFTKQNLTFLSNDIIPNDVAYHNTFFLITSSPVSVNPSAWYAFEFDTPTTVKLNTQFFMQTKATNAIGVHRLPGRGNNVILFGDAVAEIWNQVGGDRNYARVSSFNIDSGVSSIFTIAANAEFVCWLGINEDNSPAIMVTSGSSVKRISTDGIDHLLESLVRPDLATSFLYRQDGHLFYQFTFFGEQDNLSLVYDFNVDKFYNVSDENINFHPAREIAHFNGKTYFISIKNAQLFEMNTDLISYNYNIDPNVQGEVIPRQRICKTVRRSGSERFRIKQFVFWIEQGITDVSELSLTTASSCDGLMITEDVGAVMITESGEQMLTEGGTCLANSMRPLVDLSLSKNGNQSFGIKVRKLLNTQGNHQNRITWQRMGDANEITLQLQFWGLERFVVNNGILDIYV